ncbi:LLM class flavin-dependent oxidoreductase [Streptomyces hoynatensis]|uniref:LLM class flavin-dependent oxidoreductase n=1 Tax=Streptomyces hoynatensis TaxID=1141874 RepID=A0A3A9YPQ8_9ACTN|nr:LLM class flavin-dependent oxidoreductase [Streptomyces hoynatensis]RKN38028.1 LLM class flavin-dependent oxidoreductase [Streptomyces hoynatensis]
MADSRVFPPRLSTVILPVHRWAQGGRRTWQRAEELGFHTAYTYDHLSWRTFRDRPWFGALPTLTAAAAATERIRLGTMVASLNFRHPVTLAKELITLDDVSEGRCTLGIGAGGTGFDATVLGGDAWSPRERADRFAEFVRLLDRLLSEGAAPGVGVSYQGEFYSARGARNIPGCVQRPRLPFAVAATGARGMRLAARHGQAWVTTGDAKTFEGTAADFYAGLARQVERLDAVCEDAGREPETLERILLHSSLAPAGLAPLSSLSAFADYAGRAAELGFRELVVHWPIPDSVFDTDRAVFERIATEGLRQLAG